MKKFILALIAVLALAQGAAASELTESGVLILTRGDDPLTGIDREAVKEIIVQDGVTVLGESIFSGCSKAEAVSLPLGLTLVGKNAFSGCASLTSVKIPSTVSRIEENAFGGCAFMKSAVIPESVTYIADNAFSSPVKIYGYSGSYAAVYANRRVYRRDRGGFEEIIKEKFNFESIDGCDSDEIEVYQSGVPKVNFFRKNSESSPITSQVSWLSQPDIYGIITVYYNNEFFWTDRSGVRFDSYFDARDAHRANEFNFTEDRFAFCGEIGGENYDVISRFDDGLAIVGRDGKYGVIDSGGVLTAALTFSDTAVIGGSIFLAEGDRLLSRSMNALPQGLTIDEYNSFGGRFMVRDGSGSFGFADKNLNVVIPIKYNRIPWGADYPFRSNSETACLAIGEKLILVDKNGNELLYFN